MSQVIVGRPGILTGKLATPRIVFKGTSDSAFLPGGKIIDGSKSGDPLNTENVRILRAGLLMGIVTASGKYAPSIIGATTAAYTSGGTTLTVSAATATELARRIGSSGTFKAVGPPSAAGTVAATTVTYSAVNTTTGAITVSDLGVNKISGTWIQGTDGSENMVSVIPDGFGLKVTDRDGTSVDIDFQRVPYCGILISANIINWPSDTSLRSWIQTKLNTYGKFTFDSNF